MKTVEAIEFLHKSVHLPPETKNEVTDKIIKLHEEMKELFPYKEINGEILPPFAHIVCITEKMFPGTLGALLLTKFLARLLFVFELFFYLGYQTRVEEEESHREGVHSSQEMGQ